MFIVRDFRLVINTGKSLFSNCVTSNFSKLNDAMKFEESRLVKLINKNSGRRIEGNAGGPLKIGNKIYPYTDFSTDLSENKVKHGSNRHSGYRSIQCSDLFSLITYIIGHSNGDKQLLKPILKKLPKNSETEGFVIGLSNYDGSISVRFDGNDGVKEDHAHVTYLDKNNIRREVILELVKSLDNIDFEDLELAINTGFSKVNPDIYAAKDEGEDVLQDIILKKLCDGKNSNGLVTNFMAIITECGAVGLGEYVSSFNIRNQ